MGLKMNNVNIMGFTKKQYIYGELPKKGGLGQFSGDLVKKREDVFEGCVDNSMGTDLILVHDRT